MDSNDLLRRARLSREARQRAALSTDQISQSVSEVTRSAAWGPPEDTATRRIDRSGYAHPGAAAAAYVAEALGQFELHGSMYPRFAGMHRTSGQGGHGITEGVLLVDVDVKPHLGRAARLNVPVMVKAGAMIQPVMFFHENTPYVLCQSALDDVMDTCKVDQTLERARPSMYSPPPGGGSPRRSFASYLEDAAEGYSFDASSGAVTRFAGLGVEDDNDLDLDISKVATLFEGGTASLATEIKIPDRGGVFYTLPKGSDVEILRDYDGTGAMFVCRHESGLECILTAEALS